MFRLTRYLRPACIRMELTSRPDPDPDPDANPEKLRWRLKESILREIVDSLVATERAGNPNKLFIDLLNRERKASTAVGQGVAIPHVRTLQAKGFIIAYARSTEGLDFDAVDGLPVHHFLALAAPPFDDATYLKIYRAIGAAFSDPRMRQALLEAADEHDIIRILSHGPGRADEDDDAGEEWDE